MSDKLKPTATLQATSALRRVSRGRAGHLLAFALLLLLALPALAGCDEGLPPEAEGKLNAVATTGMIADIVRSVGGERVYVTQLMGAGVDPHVYTATEGDVITLTEADVIFYNGLHLEARMADVLARINERIPTVAVGERVPEDRRLFGEAFEGQPDPHIWMDVSLWMLATEAVRDALIAQDPAGEQVYRDNAGAYLAQLEALDGYVRAQIDTIPERQRVLVTAHDAFNYFGRAYDIEVFAPQGISTQSEAGVEDIRRTVDVLVAREVPAIFVETSVPRDVVEAIVEGARARGHDVEIGGSLYSDAMGELGTPDGTYQGMIRHNVDTIVAALAPSE